MIREIWIMFSSGLLSGGVVLDGASLEDFCKILHGCLIPRAAACLWPFAFSLCVVFMPALVVMLGLLVRHGS